MAQRSPLATMHSAAIWSNNSAHCNRYARSFPLLHRCATVSSVVRATWQAGTTAELEEYLKMHGDALIEFLGDEVDRLELNIQAEMPEVKYIELEIM